MSLAGGNLFAGLAPAGAEEQISPLLERPSLRVARIVSHAQASPPGFWYDQDWSEWVAVLAGSAVLLIEHEDAPRTLRPGDWLDLPAHTRHRVESTDSEQPTIWLAVHYR